MKLIRITALILFAAMLSACLFSCASTEEGQTTASVTATETGSTESITPSTGDESTSETPAQPTATPTETPVTPTPTDTPAQSTETPATPTPTETPAQPTETPAQPTETPAQPTETQVQPTETPVTPTPTETPAQPTETPVTPTPTETPAEPPYEFPANGVLGIVANGEADKYGAIGGNNPSLTTDDKILVFFDFADKKAGLDLAEDTEITYSFRKTGGSTVTGTATLDHSVETIKNEYGYIGVCFEVTSVLDRFESATISFSFTDKNGKEFKVNNKKFSKGVSYYGITKDKFDKALKKYGVETKVNNTNVVLKATINGVDFTLTVGLPKWAGNTSPDQIVTCSELFFYCYPRMYKRFGAAGNSPTSVTLAFENEGYGIASAGGSFVHIHDMWLRQNRNDFDCLTHEFAHVIQNGWNGDTCEYSGYIERFADCCRYLYAFNDGKTNDLYWTLNTVEGESTRETSVRFLVWFDYFYSTEGNDLLLKFFTVCRSENYPASKWANAWAEIFDGSALEGLSIEEIWDMYVESDFAHLSAKRTSNKKPSELLGAYNIREKLAEREEKM